MALKRGLSKSRIMDEAVLLAESKGYEHVGIQELAARLSVRPASLYNHISGIEEVLQYLALLAIRQLEDVMRNAAVGRSRGDAVKAIAAAYRQFAREHYELYKAFIQSASIRNAELEKESSVIVGMLLQVFRGFRHDEDTTIHFTRGFRSMLHGFVSLEAAGFFTHGPECSESFSRLIDMYVAVLEGTPAL